MRGCVYIGARAERGFSKAWKFFRLFFPILVSCWLAAGCARAPQPPPPGTLVGVTARIKGFDPALAGDVASLTAVARIYEPLYQYHPTAQPARLEPLLTTDLPRAADETGRVWDFPLRTDVRFSDDPCFTHSDGRGRALTADDVRYGLLRVADPRVGSPGYWTLRGRVVGLDDWRAAAGAATDDAPYDRPPEGLQTPDPQTLRIVLTRPDPTFFWTLTLPYAAAVAREAVRHYGPAFGRHPVGTGPFVLAGWRRNYSVTYTRNPAWTRRAEAAQGLPRPERLTYYVVGDPATQWALFRQGRLDLVGVTRDTWAALTDAAGALRPEWTARGVRLLAQPGLETAYIGFNGDDPVVGKNRALRQALCRAFDAAAWQRFYQGRVQSARGPLPPRLADAPAGPRAQPFDLDGARRLLAEAGYPGGRDPARAGRPLELTLELGDADQPETRQSTELLIQFWARLGVVVRPSYNNRPVFFEKLGRRQAQLFRLTWVADYPDAENFLQLFHSRNASPGANRANYANPEYDARFDEFRALRADDPRRRESIARLDAILGEDCPWLALHHPLQIVAYRDRLKNYTLRDFPYGMEKYLEPAL